MHTHPSITRLALLWLGALTATGCAANDDERVAQRGLAVWSVTAEPVVEIGAQDGQEEYLFERISGVRLLRDGGLAVADRGTSSIRVFGSRGEFRTEMGQEGDGPGEFRGLSHLALVPPDTLLAYDGAAHRLTRFRFDGDVVATWPIRAEDGFPELYLGTYSNGDVAIGWIRSKPRSRDVLSADLMMMGRFGRTGSLVSLLGTAFGMRRLGPGPVPFSPYLHAHLVRDSVFYTDGLEATIEVLGGEGVVTRTISIPVPEVAAEQAWMTLRAELGAREQAERLQAVPDEARSEPIPRIAEVLVDDQERFWVKQYDPRADSWMLGGWDGARGGHWTVVDVDGTIVAEIDLPARFSLMDIRGDRVAGIVRDELDVERVRVYGLSR